jgi:hypothetical protein
MSKYIIAFISLAFSFISKSQVVILNEDFQLGFPANWTMVDVDQQIPNAVVSEYSYPWIIKADPQNTVDSVVSSTSFYEPVGRANKWLITPAITLGEFGNYLSWEAKSHDPSYPENYKVLISTSNQVADFLDTVRLVVLENPEWTTREIDLSGLGFNGQTVYLAFVNTTNDGFKLYLDDINVRKNDPVGIEELADVFVQVYPNPTTGNIKINCDKEIDKVSVFSLDGKLMQQMKYNNVDQIDLSILNSGVYLINMEIGGNLKTVRVIKK